MRLKMTDKADSILRQLDGMNNIFMLTTVYVSLFIIRHSRIHLE